MRAKFPGCQGWRLWPSPVAPLSSWWHDFDVEVDPSESLRRTGLTGLSQRSSGATYRKSIEDGE